MAKVKKGDTVQVRYTGRLKRNDSVFDATPADQQLELKVGEGTTLWAFEDALVGMEPGERKTVEIPAPLAFGRPLRNMERVLRKDLMPEGVRVRPGQHLRITLEHGRQSVVKVLQVSGQDVVVDTNHPLAGEDLVFEVELVAIVSAAT
jgi:peptidylprolyl isomerase